MYLEKPMVIGRGDGEHGLGEYLAVPGLPGGYDVGLGCVGERKYLGSYMSVPGLPGGRDTGLGFFPGFSQIVSVAGGLLSSAGSSSDAERWDYLNQILDNMDDVLREAQRAAASGQLTQDVLADGMDSIDKIRDDFHQFTINKGDQWWRGAWTDWAQPKAEEVLDGLAGLQSQVTGGGFFDTSGDFFPDFGGTGTMQAGMASSALPLIVGVVGVLVTMMTAKRK